MTWVACPWPWVVRQPGPEARPLCPSRGCYHWEAQRVLHTIAREAPAASESRQCTPSPGNSPGYCINSHTKDKNSAGLVIRGFEDYQDLEDYKTKWWRLPFNHFTGLWKPPTFHTYTYICSLSVRVLQGLQKNSFFRNISHSKDIYDSAILAVQNIIHFKRLSKLGKTSPLHRLRISRSQTVFSKIQLYSETLIQRDKGVIAGVGLVSYLCVCVCLCLYKSILHTDLDRNIYVYIHKVLWKWQGLNFKIIHYQLYCSTI